MNNTLTQWSRGNDRGLQVETGPNFIKNQLQQRNKELLSTSNAVTLHAKQQPMTYERAISFEKNLKQPLPTQPTPEHGARHVKEINVVPLFSSASPEGNDRNSMTISIMK